MSTRPRLLGGVLLAAWGVGWHVDPLAAQGAWLAGWWFCLSLSLGGMTHLWIHRLTGGRWGLRSGALSRALARQLPWVLVAALPWLLALPTLYPWTGGAPPSAETAPVWQVARPAFRQLWFSPLAFQGRLALYGITWLALWRWCTGPAMPKGRAAAALMAHALITSLAVTDLIMALAPRWYSSAFALIILVAQSLGAWALLTMLTAWRARASRGLPSTGEDTADLLHDLGNLLMMFMMSWAYMAFMEYLIIWSENLPREIGWYLPRLQGGWGVVTLVVASGLFIVPQGALLMRAVKRHPLRLASTAALILASHALYCAWLIMPSVRPHSPHAAWMLALAFAGISLIIFGGLPPRQEPEHHGRP